MRLAEIFTGTPSRVSTIIKPDPTSFTHRASKAYLRGHNHWSQRRTGGMVLRWTKKPANVIWYRAESALTSVAIPPFSKTVANKKFCKRRGAVSHDHRAQIEETCPECHREGIQDNNKQEFEEMCRVPRQTRHPIRARSPGQSTFDDDGKRLTRWQQ